MSQLLPYSCVLIIMAEKTGNKWKKTRKIPASASAKEPRLLTCYDNVNIQWLVMLSVLRYLFHLQSLDCILSLSLQSEDRGGFFVRPQSPHFVSWFMWKLEWFSPMSCIGATHCCCCKHYFGFLIKVELLSCSHCCSCREGENVMSVRYSLACHSLAVLWVQESRSCLSCDWKLGESSHVLLLCTQILI